MKDIKSTNAELQAYVMRKLERIDVGKNELGIRGERTARFVFRPQ